MTDPRQWSFDIDRYLNRVVPPPPWRYVPYPLARFMGYRTEGDGPKPGGNLVAVFWAFIGAFCGVALVEGVSMNVPSFDTRSAPLIVGSFGATAVLEFYAIESPLAQPRNAFFGHTLSSLVGVAVCKLFLLSNDFDSLRWLGGAIACAAATSVMALTKTVHPPAGATALLAVTDDTIRHLGWFYTAVMMLGCVLMLAVALLVNNVERRFPQYWWTAADLRSGRQRQRAATLETSKIGASNNETKDVESEAGAAASTCAELEAEATEIVIRPGKVTVPESVDLSDEERLVLEDISRRL